MNVSYHSHFPLVFNLSKRTIIQSYHQAFRPGKMHSNNHSIFVSATITVEQQLLLSSKMSKMTRVEFLTCSYCLKSWA